MNLKRKITLLLLFVCIISISTVAAFGYMQSRELVTESIVGFSENLAGRYAIEINEFFSVQSQIVRDIASTIQYEGSYERDFLQGYLTNRTDINDISRTVYFASPTRADGDFITGDGWIAPEDYDWTTRPWFIGAVETGETFITSPYVDASTGGMVVTIAEPILENGRLVGVVSTDIMIDTVIDIVGSADDLSTSYAFLVDHEGKFVAHPNEAFISVDKVYSVQEVIGHPLEEILIGDAETLGTYSDYNGEDTLFIGATVPETTWQFVIATPTSELADAISNLRNIFIAVIGTMFIIIIILANVVSGVISKPLNYINTYAKKVAALDVKEDLPDKIIQRKDEIGELASSFQAIISNLRTFAGEITTSSRQVAGSSQQLTATSQQSATASEEIAKTIESIAESASIQSQNTKDGVMQSEELAQHINTSIQVANDLNEITKTTESLKDRGTETVEKLNEATEKNITNAKRVNEMVIESNKSIGEISTIAETISAIAEQTNLLALNASIEAARAGEAGRGFAVVAQEIRKLAEQTGHSLEDINKIVMETQQKSKTIVDSMGEVTDSAENQVKTVKTTGNVFNSLALAVNNTKNKAEELTSVNEEMEKAKEKILGVIENLSSLSEENAAATEEVAASIEEQTAAMGEISTASEGLAELAGNLQQIVEQFNT